MLTTVEGVYKQGRVELKETPADAPEGRVLVTFLEPVMEAETGVEKNGRGAGGPGPTARLMACGQFAGPRVTNEDDFHQAEWRDENADDAAR